MEKKASSPTYKLPYTIFQNKQSDFIPNNESTFKHYRSNFLDSVEKDIDSRSKYDDIFINPYENVD